MTDDFITDVYNTLRSVILEEYQVPGVENVFAEGSQCDQLYSEMLLAYHRLRARLGVTDEDADVEIIINSLMTIADILAFKMYHCGAQFGL